MRRQRSAVAVVTTLALVLAVCQTLGSASAATFNARGTKTERASTAPTGATAFVAGSATATSQAFQIAPVIGGLSAAVTVGRSIADYANDLSQASSQALDLGLIGSSATVQCSSLPPAVTAGELPKALVAESDSVRSADKTTAGPDTKSATVAAGRQYVTAAPSPHEAATADFDGTNINLPGVLSVKGLSSHSYAQLIDGKARIAEATADASSLDLLGGQVQISGMHWDLSVQTGEKPARSSSFSVGSISVGGIPLPTTKASLTSTIATVNKVLASSGLRIDLPSFTDTAGVIGISPLSLGLATTKSTAKILNPLITLLFSDVGGSAVDAAAKAVCQIGSVYGVVNLLIGSLDGDGSFAINLGGVTATTDDTTYANPFGSGGVTPPKIGGTVVPPASSTGPSVSATIPPLPEASGTEPPAPSPDVAPRDVASSCSTISPAGRPSCSRGAGLAIGLIALATLGGVAAADYLVVRRRRRLAGMAIE